MSLEGLNIGRYHLLQLLGSGGMGEVYLGNDVPVNRQVAIKVIRAEVAPYPDIESTKEAARLFQREVKAIAGLDHPNILPLYDYGEELVQGVNTTYMVMPYRAEGTLTAWLQKRANIGLLSPADVAHIVSQAASALQYAHEHNIVHQDIKPSNFLIRGNDENPQQPYLQLSDFGVAKISSATSSVSQSIRGTPAYMAPEQWSGNAVPATDQYALAVMAYELLTGHLPFQGGLGQMMYQHMHTKPQPPSTYSSHIPAELDEVLLLALEKEPEKRFLTVAAFAKGFQQAIQTMESATLNPVSPNRLNTYEQTIASTPYHQMQGGEQGSLAPLYHQEQQPIYAPPPPMYEFARGSNAAQPAYAPHVATRKPSRLPIGLTMGMVVLALLIIVGGGFYFARANSGNGGNTPTPVVALTQPASTGTPTSTATSVPTATPTTGSTNPYTSTGTLVLNDPLANNSQSHVWLEGKNSLGASCYFSNGAYYSAQPNAGYFHSCMGQATNFANFVLEVQITLISGDYEGIVFRVNPANPNQYYYFSIDQKGNYVLRRSMDTNFNDTVVIDQGTSPTILLGQNQTNVVAVVANFGNIDLYVNHQKIASVSDNILSHGQIGFFVGNDGTNAVAMFSYAKVWQL